MLCEWSKDGELLIDLYGFLVLTGIIVSGLDFSKIMKNGQMKQTYTGMILRILYLYIIFALVKTDMYKPYAYSN